MPIQLLKTFIKHFSIGIVEGLLCAGHCTHALCTLYFFNSTCNLARKVGESLYLTVKESEAQQRFK